MATGRVRGQLNALRAADPRIIDVRGAGLVWHFEVVDHRGCGDPVLGEEVRHRLARNEDGWRARLIGDSTIMLVLEHDETSESALFRDALLDVRRVLSTTSLDHLRELTAP
ncbi:hypothetical protein [Herbiconiux sp. YIM B11900]|uniref:hypothetical protein n=1 Tax=Herbiconiux sp. YIM B11900 TaxID=3404131 RepID=UPI003F834DFB